ncbi:Oxygen-dependent choline dehydrogenase [Rhizoctonia solani]|uniref:Oxygen-dependent choline dehydrogenase n=1 Tax=Rhizoctonia solani TaxID=456999 RepID=A0A0K6GCN8_9AGAM|nr:Oxygen-dependent choline dehydrogenase [Rhizoctonia solani]
MQLLFSLPIIASFGVAAGKISQRVISTSGADFALEAFDYVVVGGGTAGLTLAARLSENPKTTVGVIESGDYLPDDPLINTPSSAFSIAGNAKYDWLFKSVPQANLNNRVLDLPRGKILGGSSAINIMVFDRASKVEYDAWAKLGSPGWDWNDLLPNMEAAERFTGVDPFRVNYTHANPDSIFPSQGTSGPVAASYNNWYGDITVPFGKSMANLGIPTNFDPDSGNAFGTFNSATSVNRTTGRRSYAATTYYAYNAHRLNLVVLTGAQATKINFKENGSSKKTENLVATGVSFVHNSQTYTVKAKKEVILSAGTFQSPHLLELSGIGNSMILEKNGVKTLIDLPGVGENYQDHIYVRTTYELKPGSSVQDLDVLRNDAAFAAAAAAQYNSTHDGILSYSGSILSFINLDFMATSEEISNMTARLDQEIASENITPLQKASYDIQREWLKEKVGLVEVIMNPGYAGVGVPKANTSYMSLVTAIQHPFSRGNIRKHINTSDPLVAPRIDPNYFSKSIETLALTIKFGQKLSKTEPLASMIVARQDPAPEVTSDAAIIEYVKANAQSIHHPIGTAALAPKELGGVVDVNLKVYGTDNVRVVDASIIPLHIGTHIQRTVYGIAEKAAAIIKETLD